jgi:hypothetical protein
MSKSEILELKEKVHELKEYLYSDLCKACGDAALALDKINERLIKLESQQNS